MWRQIGLQEWSYYRLTTRSATQRVSLAAILHLAGQWIDIIYWPICAARFVIALVTVKISSTIPYLKAMIYGFCGRWCHFHRRGLLGHVQGVYVPADSIEQFLQFASEQYWREKSRPSEQRRMDPHFSPLKQQLLVPFSHESNSAPV